MLWQVSWCKFEVIVDSPKDIRVPLSSKITLEIPPVVVSAINLKTIINEKQNINEIVSASIVCCRRAKVSLRGFAGNATFILKVRFVWVIIYFQSLVHCGTSICLTCRKLIFRVSHYPIAYNDNPIHHGIL